MIRSGSGSLLLICLFSAVHALSCGDDDNPTSAGGNGGGGGGDSGSGMTAEVNGSDWTATWTSALAQTGLQITGVGPFSPDSVTVSIMLNDNTTGTYDLLGMTNMANSSVRGGKSYTTAFGSGHGTVKVTRKTSSVVEGSFSFVAYNSGGADSMVVYQGEFNLELFTVP